MTTNDREVPHETRVFVDIVVVPGAGSLQAVIGRDAQFAMAPGTFQLMAYEQGRRLVAVMSILTRNAVNIVMHRDVARERGVTEKSPLADKVRALKGLKLSGFARGALGHQIIVHYLLKVGLDPQKDVQIVGLGTSPALLVAATISPTIGGPSSRSVTNRPAAISAAANGLRCSEYPTLLSTRSLTAS
jgi:ABC-type nitrate/sulfonate/bicarbonate transport system substrate-binding protein